MLNDDNCKQVNCPHEIIFMRYEYKRFIFVYNRLNNNMAQKNLWTREELILVLTCI